jgi:hypothetical protein
MAGSSQGLQKGRAKSSEGGFHFCKKKILKKNFKKTIKKGRSRIHEYEIYEIDWAI